MISLWVHRCIPSSLTIWWERSLNSGNTNNFCNVNTNGTANNNNARNSNGVAPDFKTVWVAKSTKGNMTLFERSDVSRGLKRPKSIPPMALHGRFLHGKRFAYSCFMCKAYVNSEGEKILQFYKEIPYY